MNNFFLAHNISYLPRVCNVDLSVYSTGTIGTCNVLNKMINLFIIDLNIHMCDIDPMYELYYIIRVFFLFSNVLTLLEYMQGHVTRPHGARGRERGAIIQRRCTNSSS